MPPYPAKIYLFKVNNRNTISATRDIVYVATASTTKALKRMLLLSLVKTNKQD